ncbi:hypothetical protein K505DRAFT_257453, partial [Melanomma pulvis-pyrius CBS 109.77]
APAVFSREEKEKLASDITNLYTKVGLPEFYVNIHFTELPLDSFYVGKKSSQKSAFLSILHGARTFANKQQQVNFMERIDSFLRPTMEPREINWELVIEETSLELWRMNGLVPPPAGSEQEKEWARLNRPVKPYV